MKKLWVGLAMMLLLQGCSQLKDYETMSDVYEQPELSPAARISVDLPQNAAVTAMQSQDGSKLYLCDDYSIVLQTFQGGDLRATLKTANGYDPEKLRLMVYEQGQLTRYECAWAAAGEGGDQVGRTVLLDDGSYHYTLTLMADAACAGRQTAAWQKLLGSFTIDSTDSEKG